LAKCIDRGLEDVQQAQADLLPLVNNVRSIWQTLDPAEGSAADRKPRFEKLRDEFATNDSPIPQHFSKVMSSFEAGLFAGDEPTFPRDNLELERWFRAPKGHARRIHGRRHAGASLVQEGATLALALDAHQRHVSALTSADLLPYVKANRPASEQTALCRRHTMKRARSKKQRPMLLAQLEARYTASFQ
jgi:hypothetical protein